MSTTRDRHVTFSLRRLLVLVAVVVAVGAITVWLARRGEEAATDDTAGTEETVADAAAAGESPEDPLSAAMSDFEQVLEENRGDLDPETVQAFEVSLESLNGAIEQTREALKEDPESEYLNTHLAETMQRKLEVLREAAMLTQPAI